MTSKLRRISLSACGLAALALAMTADRAGAQELNATEKKLMAAAKAEGEVTILNPLFADETGRNLGDAFKKRYDLGANFKVNNVRKGTGQVVAQARQEILAGKLTSDIVIVSAPLFYEEAAKRGAFLPLDSGYWKDHEEVAKKAGQYFNYPHVVLPFAYTFQPVWNASCPGMENFNPTSYADVATAALAKKTIASDVSKSITYANTVAALQESGAVDIPKLWAAIKTTDPVIEFRTEAKMQMVVSCERPFDMWNLSGRVAQNIEKKPELAKALKIGSYKEGHVMLGNQAAVLKGAAHPNAALLMIEFMLSKEGTDILVVGEGVYSFMKGYKPPAAMAPYLLDLEKIKLIGMKEWTGSDAQKDFKSVRDEWQKIFQ